MDYASHTQDKLPIGRCGSTFLVSAVIYEVEIGEEMSDKKYSIIQVADKTVRGILLANVHGFLEQRGYTVLRIVKRMRTTTDAEAIAEPCINLFACPAELYPEHWYPDIRWT